MAGAAQGAKALTSAGSEGRSDAEAGQRASGSGSGPDLGSQDLAVGISRRRRGMRLLPQVIPFFWHACSAPGGLSKWLQLARIWVGSS